MPTLKESKDKGAIWGWLPQLEIHGPLEFVVGSVERGQLESIRARSKSVHGHLFAQRNHWIRALLCQIDSEQSGVRFLLTGLPIQYAHVDGNGGGILGVGGREERFVDLRIEDGRLALLELIGAGRDNL